MRKRIRSMAALLVAGTCLSAGPAAHAASKLVALNVGTLEGTLGHRCLEIACRIPIWASCWKPAITIGQSDYAIAGLR